MDKMDCFFLGMILGAFIALVLLNLSDIKHPTAIDVYRGKTTLEITYKDSVAIDSVVVFKNK